MRKNISKSLRVAATAFSTAILAGTALSGAAQAAPAGGAGAMACGYYETSDTAYYGHCGSGSVIIEIDINWSYEEEYRCVGQGETTLGTASRIVYAHSIGTC
ncbi:DUF6355 family natural product biosynthesis protein [Streptomyces beigongshangae]|uniref:DUF6355 family natural product biosynthesis protein n=1 Tax=Streptomyces beigongshangae TaxID=2841597 RepID=UPI001C85EE0B|nr:DUF6355 family natural product biosynthesis protein [Streptomyces sp. REN17]